LGIFRSVDFRSDGFGRGKCPGLDCSCSPAAAKAVPPRCCCCGRCSGAGGRRSLSRSPSQDSSLAPEATPPRLLLSRRRGLLLRRRGPAMSRDRRPRWRSGWSGRPRCARPCGGGWPTAAPCTADTSSTPSTASGATANTAPPSRYSCAPAPNFFFPFLAFPVFLAWVSSASNKIFLAVDAG
jgi:hypothetical protein